MSSPEQERGTFTAPISNASSLEHAARESVADPGINQERYTPRNINDLVYRRDIRMINFLHDGDLSA